MPSDNIEGFRPDTIALLKDLHAGMWRLPGGNFISDWVWYDSIGDIDKRPPCSMTRGTPCRPTTWALTNS